MKRITLLPLLFFLVFYSCNKPPEACIEVDNTTVTIGTPVTFTSCSKRALSQDWFIEGPDGAPENEMGWSDAQFTHSFTVSGTYTVILNAYSKFSFLGDVHSATTTITVQ